MDYKENVQEIFANLKQINSRNDLGIPLLRGKGFLICLGEIYASDDVMIELLAKWRREAVEMHNLFEVTFEGTKKWFRELVLDVPDRVLFLVLDGSGRRIGHMGFADAFNEELEFDLIIRGVKGISLGIMTVAAETLFDWASREIKPCGFVVHVPESNTHAIRFYARLGFVLKGKEFKHGEYHVCMRRDV